MLVPIGNIIHGGQKMKVLDLLKQSSTGLTQKEFEKKAKENEIREPFIELGHLVVAGLARFDKNPEPGRFKATPKAFPNN
ncbi:MAG: hypothetical protein NT162_03700 [Candidatus Woesebacteria bacterium]|nr:hypothetical protein [Candidatus Woesebacteria bacterium]